MKYISLLLLKGVGSVFSFGLLHHSKVFKILSEGGLLGPSVTSRPCMAVLRVVVLVFVDILVSC